MFDNETASFFHFRVIDMNTDVSYLTRIVEVFLDENLNEGVLGADETYSFRPCDRHLREGIDDY